MRMDDIMRSSFALMIRKWRPRKFVHASLVACGMLLIPLAAPAQQTVTLFVTSEATNTVNVFRGEAPNLKFVKGIPVGKDPHNMGISPDGKWVANSDRRSGEISIIDTESLTEVARIPVGKQPHDVSFSPDSRTLYVGHEVETFVSVIDVESRKKKGILQATRGQHDISLTPDGRELWFTVTNRHYRKGDPRVGILDVGTGKLITLFDSGANAHDVTLSPDGKVAWITNSGFTHMPDARVDYVDVAARKVLGSIQVGKYPFHSPKRGRDGNYLSPSTSELWVSDRGMEQIHAISLSKAAVVASVPVGKHPFHIAATPQEILFVANSGSNSVTIIDGPKRQVLGTLTVPKQPHGLAVLVRP